MAAAHALRAALTRYPHLLSVPILQAARQDQGDLAGSFFLLLEHVENQAPAFLRTAVDRALEQTGGAREPAALSRALYQLLVTKGRLRETYPAFVRDIMVAGIPTPGFWLDAAVTEDDDATIILSRRSQVVGDPAEDIHRLTQVKARLGEHHFTLAVAPLTTRFVCLRRGALTGSRDVAIRLTEQGHAADAAWLLMLRSDQVLQAPPKRLEPKGAVVPGLGTMYGGLWVGCFNAEPEGEKHLELIFTVRPAGQTARRSAFGPRPR
jgi:hypothetical protein